MYFFAVGQEGTALPMAIGGGLTVLAATLIFVVNVFANLKEVHPAER